MSRFITKKWTEVYDQSKRNYSPNKEIRINTSMFRSNLCNYSNAYIIVEWDITVTNPNNAKRNKAVAFKNNAPFINCIWKINGIKIENAEDLDVVILMYNLLEYSKNYKKTAGSLWNYYRDQPNNHLLTKPNLLNIRQVLQKILIILMLVNKIMMQIKLLKMKLKFLFH